MLAWHARHVGTGTAITGHGEGPEHCASLWAYGWTTIVFWLRISEGLHHPEQQPGIQMLLCAMQKVFVRVQRGCRKISLQFRSDTIHFKSGRLMSTP
jgi:hypothetical protein